MSPYVGVSPRSARDVPSLTSRLHLVLAPTCHHSHPIEKEPRQGRIVSVNISLVASTGRPRCGAVRRTDTTSLERPLGQSRMRRCGADVVDRVLIALVPKIGAECLPF